jgi:ATP-dependent DNA ligase
MTETYPDIIQFFTKQIPEDVTEFIMDTEIVAIDLKTNRILPF